MGQKVSASKAAKMVGKSVPTITRAIKSGKISAEPNPDGGWLIDPSELSRVWRDTPIKGDTQPNALQTETPNVTSETNVLQVELKAERDMRARLEAEIEDLKVQRDKWQDQAQTLLLTRSAEQGAGQGGRKGLFGRLFG